MPLILKLDKFFVQQLFLFEINLCHTKKGPKWSSSKLKNKTEVSALKILVLWETSSILKLNKNFFTELFCYN